MDSKALNNIGYGLYVISAAENGRHNGCIVNSVMQVTDAPLTIVASVNKKNLTHDMMLSTGVFNISMLTTDATFELFKQFGFQSGRDADKFAGVPHGIAANGVVYLTEHCNSFISGRVINTVDMGTHTIFVAEVTDARVLSSAPSVTYAYYHEHIKPRPGAPAAGKTVWRCTVCGYEYEGEELPPDIECPWCMHGASAFEKITV